MLRCRAHAASFQSRAVSDQIPAMLLDLFVQAAGIQRSRKAPALAKLFRRQLQAIGKFDTRFDQQIRFGNVAHRSISFLSLSIAEARRIWERTDAPSLY